MRRTTVLNHRLHSALSQYFGEVTLSNEGEEMICSYKQKLFNVGDDNGKRDNSTLDVEHAGEYYRVNCDKCHDTTRRLYINHRWGVPDERACRNLFLMVCYNENCYKRHRDRLDLFESLADSQEALRANRVPIRAGKTINSALDSMEMPGYCVRLDDLPADHEANIYLAQRQLLPERLGRYYDVHYCEDSHLYLARGRIIAPVRCKGKMVGYQARLPYDADWKKTKEVKWWTGPGTPRSRVFYNYDNAKEYVTGVIVEGPADVWGFGPMCHGVMGSTITRQQLNLFVRAHRNGSGVIMLDPEIMGKRRTREAIAHLKRKLKYGVVVVRLPAGEDPGSLDREWCREFVWHEAKKQNVKISWSKKNV